MPSSPAGATWTGLGGAFKEFVLANGLGPGAVPALAPLDVATDLQCTEQAADATLAPGASISSTIEWVAELAPGVPAVPGNVSVSATAQIDPSGAPPSYPPGYTGIRESWFEIYRQEAVSTKVDILPSGTELTSAGEAIDAVLGNQDFETWLAGEPQNTWSNANLFVAANDGQGIAPKGAAWELDLFRDSSKGRSWAIAFVSVRTTSLLSIDYCDAPCTR